MINEHWREEKWVHDCGGMASTGAQHDTRDLDVNCKCSGMRSKHTIAPLDEREKKKASLKSGVCKACMLNPCSSSNQLCHTVTVCCAYACEPLSVITFQILREP